MKHDETKIRCNVKTAERVCVRLRPPFLFYFSGHMKDGTVLGSRLRFSAFTVQTSTATYESKWNPDSLEKQISSAFQDFDIF